jgi:hypothetical protein
MPCAGLLDALGNGLHQIALLRRIGLDARHDRADGCNRLHHRLDRTDTATQLVFGSDIRKPLRLAILPIQGTPANGSCKPSQFNK